MTRHEKYSQKNVIALPQSNIDKISASGWRSMANWLVVLLLVLPLLYSGKTMDPNITLRYIFLSSFIILLLLFFFKTIKRYNFSFPPLTKAVFILWIIYAAWSFLSMLFAINPSLAYYEIARHLLNLILLVLIMTAISQNEDAILKLSKAMTVMAIIQSTIGILQLYQLAFEFIPGNRGFLPYGLMGHRSLFGSAQVLLLPFSIFVLYKAGRLWKYISIVAIAGIIISVFISQTRSAWVSFAVMVLIIFILNIAFSANRKKWILGTLIGIIITIITLSFIFSVNKQSSFLKSVKERFIALRDIRNDEGGISSITGRFKLWDKSVKLIKDHPLLGVGPGNWKLAVVVYDPDDYGWNDGLLVASRPHNVYLEVASETGIPGAILYFGCWILIVVMVFLVIQKTPSENIKVLIILMLAGLSAFAADSVFSFPVERIEHSLYLIIMAGTIMGYYAKLQQQGRITLKNKWFVPALFTIVFNVFMGCKKYNFEVHGNLARAYRNANRYEDVITEVETGRSKFVTISPNGDPLEIHSSAAFAALQDYPRALEEINIAKSYHPNSSRIYTTMGVIYANSKQYESAINCYLKALQLTPRYETALTNLAGVYYASGNYEACLNTLSKLTIKDSPYLLLMMENAEKKVKEQN